MNRLGMSIVSLSIAALVATGCSTTKEPTTNATVPAPTAVAPTPVAAVAEGKQFGEPLKLTTGDAITVKQLNTNLDGYTGKFVRVTGTVNKVCERKGCWIELADGNGQPLFVKFTCPIEGRLIPIEAKGKPVVVEGVVKVKEISEDDAKHLKEEAGATPEEIAKIKGPQKQLTLASPSALVAGL